MKIKEPPKEKKCIFNVGLMLGLRFFMVRNAKELHFAILDVFLKVLYKGRLYSFCDEYSGCEDYYWRKRYCPLCQIPVDLHNAEKLCDYKQFPLDELCKISLKFVPYLKECFDVMDSETLIELFNDRQHSTYTRDSYTGAKTETTLEEEIEFTTKLKRLNGEEKYFKNLYG